MKNTLYNLFYGITRNTVNSFFSFVNNINTIKGGTHIVGFKFTLIKVYNKHTLEMGILKDSVIFLSENIL